MVLVEVSVEGVVGLRAAERGGAARIELASSLIEGGTTPSHGALERARAGCALALVALIRPRGGDFLYGPEERAVMRADVLAAKELGLEGVALGCLTAEGEVDEAATGELVELARPLQVVFHRAFDLVRDPRATLETLIRLGLDRVLSSGQERTALAGIPCLRGLVEQARGRIALVAAGGVRAENAPAIVAGTGVRELHLSGGARVESAMRHRNPRPRLAGAARAPEEYARWETDEELVRAVVRSLAGA